MVVVLVVVEVVAAGFRILDCMSGYDREIVDLT